MTSESATEHTHYCGDCDVELALMYDDRGDESVPIVCGHCGGTNTRRLALTDGGRDTAEAEIVHDSNGIEVPAELDGVDLLSADACPNCGDEENHWIVQPAGYYTCPTCFSTWAGNRDDASIVDYCEVDHGA